MTELKPGSGTNGTTGENADAVPKPDDASKRSNTWRNLRWGLAILIALAGAIAFVVLRLSGAAEVCSDVPAAVGLEPIAEACQPVGVADFLPIWVAALLLLLPDLTELTLPGLGSLKFRTQEVEAKQAELEQRLVEVQSNVAVQSAQQTTVVVDIAGLKTDFEERQRAFQGDSQSRRLLVDPPASAADVVAVDPNRAQLEVALLRLWDTQLWPWTELARYARGRKWSGLIRTYIDDPARALTQYGGATPDALRRVVPEGLTHEQLGTVLDWAEAFESEIEAVRAARNGIAHPREAQPLSTPALGDLLDIGERTARVLQESLGA